MVWIRLGTYTATLELQPELYDLEGRWVELLRDPPDPKPYERAEVAAELASGTSYWYVTEDLTDIAVGRLCVAPGDCRVEGGTPSYPLYEPWLRVPKGVFAPGRQAAKVLRAFASADANPESAPRFLRTRLVRAPSSA